MEALEKKMCCLESDSKITMLPVKGDLGGGEGTAQRSFPHVCFYKGSDFGKKHRYLEQEFSLSVSKATR